MRNATRILWATLACTPALSGCTSTRQAIIERTDGGELNARVVGGTPTHVLVQPELERGALGDTVAIRRDQIADIDHHGNVMMVIFAPLGIPLLSSIPPAAQMMIDGKFRNFRGDERQNGLGNVFGFLALAFCLLPWALSVKGGIEWGSSRYRAATVDGDMPTATPTVEAGPQGLIFRF